MKAKEISKEAKAQVIQGQCLLSGFDDQIPVAAIGILVFVLVKNAPIFTQNATCAYH